MYRANSQKRAPSQKQARSQKQDQLSFHSPNESWSRPLLRVTGFCLLGALVVHGAAALVPFEDPGLEVHSFLYQLPLLPPELPAGELAPPAEIGLVTALAEPPPATETLAAAHPSRGPPSPAPSVSA